ncbi:MAG: hypothetical protein AAFU54_20815 [Chloroflexota bacterium]
MMYEAKWANENHTAVFVEFNGVWEVDDFERAEHDLTTMLSEVGHRVSVVVNITEPRPISMHVLENVRNLITVSHPNRDRVVMVAPDGFLQGMQHVIVRAFGGNAPRHLHFASDLDSAERVLNH